MARPGNPKYANHPLKLLRKITGLSQAAFAEITGISLDVIRSSEVGRRGGGELSGQMVGDIYCSLGALWDPEQKQWLFVLSGARTRVVSYVREHFETFRQELRSEASEREAVVYYLVNEFLSFCEAIPGKAFNGWFWKLDYLLDQWHKEVPWPRTPFQLEPDWSYKSARVLGYRKMFPSLLQGEEKRFGELIEQAREQAEKQRARSAASMDESIRFAEEQKAERTKQEQKRPRRSRRS